MDQRWLRTTSLHTSALLAVLKKTGPAIVVCHSQGGEITFDAIAQAPELFDRIIALEPSGFPQDADTLGDTELTLVAGDFLDTAPHWIHRAKGWSSLVANAANVTLINSASLTSGNSHMLMMDENSDILFKELLGK